MGGIAAAGRIEDPSGMSITNLSPLFRIAVSAAVLAAFAAAHGGMYRGPGQVPALPGGPFTPGGPAPRGGPTTGGAPLPSSTPESWQYWWEFNKDRYLDLRAAVLDAKVPVDDEGGTQASGLEPLRPTPTEIDEVVLPALDRLMQRYDHPDVATAGMIAIAKIGRLHPSVDVPGRIRANLRSGNQEVRETAALALGISGLDEVLPDLVALARDEAEGRRLTGRTSVDARSRAFACYGLGLAARRSEGAATKELALAAAAAVLDRPDLLDRDLAVAAIQALGVLRPAWSDSAQKRIGWQALQLLDGFWGRDLGRADQIVQAHVPTAVARLIGRGLTSDHRRYIETWVAALGGRDRDDPVHQSMVLALGEIALPPESSEVAGAASDALWNYYRKGKDEQARFFALVALGRIGGEANRTALLEEIRRARKGTEKPWAALALGLLARGTRDATGTVDDLIGRTLLHELRNTANDEFRPACAIALGLCGHLDAARELRQMLDKYERHDVVAGYLSVGLAMLPDPAARADIGRVLRRAEHRPALVMQGAIAVALLGGGDAGDELMALWESGESNLARLAGIATAFRFVGDRRAIEPLVRMMFARDTTTTSRAFVAAALGGICDKDMLPWSEPFSAGCNYAAVVPTLTNGVTGILDIL
jgi:HEAT repeat protein